MSQSRYGEAASAFDEAVRSFRGVSVTGGDLAATSHAQAVYHLGHFDDALKELAAADSLHDIHRYALASGERQWVRAMALLASGRADESLACYRDAVARFDQAGEEESAAFVRSLIAENLTALGDENGAWEQRFACLKTFQRFNDPRRTHVVYNEMAEAAMVGGYEHAALTFQDEAVRLVSADSDSLPAAYALMWRGLIRSRLQDADASRDLQEAFADANRIPDQQARARTMADLDMAAGFAAERTHPAIAIERYGKALQYFRASGYRFRSAQLLLARGRLHLGSHEEEAALADFRDGISEVERQGAAISEERLQATFFGKAEDLFSEAVGLLTSKGEYAEALNIAERGRERALTNAVMTLAKDASSSSGSDTVNAVRDQLPPSTLVTEYSILPKEIVIWTISRSGLATVRKPFEAGRLENLIAAYRNAISSVNQDQTSRGGDVDGQKAASDLYDLLIRPVATAGVTKLVIIPEGPLNDLPFAALFDSRSRRYLVQDLTIAIAPSIRVFVRKGQVGEPKNGGGTLAFGGTHFEREDLPDLPAAGDELRLVSRCHRKGTLLIDETATKARFEALAPQADIVQFAGHAVVNAEEPSSSSLVFGPPDAEGTKRLSVHDIIQLRFNSRLVVLSACDTGTRSGARHGGASSIARAFLVAGVPTVISTLWRVGDESSMVLMERLHRELERGMDAADALREAQLQMLSSATLRDRRPNAWAAFHLVGRT
jgi:CHAT domain-containing protein